MASHKVSWKNANSVMLVLHRSQKFMLRCRRRQTNTKLRRNDPGETWDVGAWGTWDGAYQRVGFFLCVGFFS